MGSVIPQILPIPILPVRLTTIFQVFYTMFQFFAKRLQKTKAMYTMSTETSPPLANGGVARAALSFRRHLPKHTARLLLLLQLVFVARVHGERIQRPALRAILKDQLGVPDEQIPSGMYDGRQSVLQKIVIAKVLDKFEELGLRENETPEIQEVINADYNRNTKDGRDTYIRSLLPLLKRREAEDAAILELRKDQIAELQRRDAYVFTKLQ